MNKLRERATASEENLPEKLKSMSNFDNNTKVDLQEKDGDKYYQNNQESKEEEDLSFSMVLFGRRLNRIIVYAHFNVFLYSCSFWVQQAVFPYLSKKLGADPVTFGYLQTTFAVVQLAGGPIFGRFGDLFGSRQAMILAMSSSALSYFVLSVSSTVPLLFLSRLASVFMHGMQAGQMIVTDSCHPNKRADALGKLGLSYGVGMVVGPVIGGFVSKFFGVEQGAAVAGLLSLSSVIFTYLYVPSMVKKKSSASDQDENVFSAAKILKLLAAPGALFLILIKMGTGIPMGIFQSMFGVVALERFQLAPDENSFIMSYIGIMAMLVQGVGIGYVVKKFSETTILAGSALVLMFGYLLLAFVTKIWHMYIVFIPLIVGLSFQNTVTTSALTHTVAKADTGAMLGLSMAVNSLIRSLSPTAGGYMLAQYGFESFGYFGFVASSVVSLVLFYKWRQEDGNKL